jgi:Spy/CpxP family protein refolding chaperone
MTRTTTILSAAALLLAAAPLSAQDTARAGAPRPRIEGRRPDGSMAARRPDRATAGRMPGTMRGNMGPGPRVGGAPAGMILGQRERLQLTDEQVRRLEALATTQREALRPNEPAMLRARADLMEAMQRDNIEGARTALDRLSRIRNDQVIAQMRARKEARDVLTAEQRTRLDDMRAGAMRGMRPVAGPGRAFRNGAVRERARMRAPARPRPNRPPTQF